MYACEVFWRVNWDGEMNYIFWIVWVWYFVDIQMMVVKSGMLVLGFSFVFCELVSEVNLYSLFFSLDIVGFVFNCCFDYFRKWVLG